jgi:hypothetical protein
MDDDETYERCEERFREIMDLLSNGSSDFWVELDLSLLEELGVLSDFREANPFPPPRFELFISEEKITLVSQQFVFWLLPMEEDDMWVTYAIIAGGLDDPPLLHQAVRARGVYNTSKMLMRMLGKYTQVIENLKA